MNNTELKPLPHEVEIERAVLGAMLISNECIPKVVGVLEDESAFYNRNHKKIFKTIIDLFKENIPPDQVTVTERLAKEKSKIPAITVAEIASEMATAANVEYHAKIIFEKAQRRRSIAIGYAAIHEGYEGEDIDKSLDLTQRRLLWIHERNYPGSELDYATRHALLDQDLSNPEHAAEVIEIIEEIENLEYKKFPEHYSQKFKNISTQIVTTTNGKTLTGLESLKELLKEKITFEATHNPQPFSEWIKMSHYTPSLVPGMIYEDEIHAFAGPPESGKSFFSAYLALSLATGTPMFDLETKPARVLIVNQDTPEKRALWRFNALIRGHHITEEDIRMATLHHYPEVLDLSSATSRLLLKQYIKINNIDLIIFDTLTKALGDLDENKSSDITRVESYFREIQKTIIYIHHTTKSSSSRGQDKLRGSTAIAGMLDSGYYFQKVDGDNNFKVSQIKQRNAPFKDLKFSLNVEGNLATFEKNGTE